MVDNLLLNDNTANPPQFYYSPDSTIWKINREQVILLGGARALLMQIAHPLVAESVYHHSYVFTKPILRLRRTLDLTLSMVFGTVEEVQHATDEINRVHRPATGRLENATGDYQAGTPYNPRNPKLALWVYATLIEGAIHGYENYLRPLSAEDKQAYYQDSKQSIGLLGVKPSRLPATYDGLMDYMQTAMTSGEVVVGETARKIAPYILGQNRWYLKPVSYPVSKMTTYLLPDPIREQYGFTINRAEATAVKLGLSLTRKSIPLLPSILRHVPPYRRAQALLKRSN